MCMRLLSEWSRVCVLTAQTNVFVQFLKWLLASCIEAIPMMSGPSADSPHSGNSGKHTADCVVSNSQAVHLNVCCE